MMWYYDDNQHFGWGGWLMMCSMILFWVLVIVGVIFAARSVTGTRTTRSTRAGGEIDGSPAFQVLAERFARGEIDEEEYRHRLSVLRELHPTSNGV